MNTPQRGTHFQTFKNWYHCGAVWSLFFNAHKLMQRCVHFRAIEKGVLEGSIPCATCYALCTMLHHMAQRPRSAFPQTPQVEQVAQSFQSIKAIHTIHVVIQVVVQRAVGPNA